MASDLEILQEALAALYRFEHMLGRGGMATVYRAHDLRHDRPVAFKVLRRELSDALGLDRRFGREIAIAAQLAHPNILGVIDSGTISGPEGKLHYYVMPFVSGESLRERLEGNTQLPLEEALQAIPVPDPVFGCMLKAGLTTTLGQTMKCYDQVKGASGGFRRVRRVFVCLAENGVGMIWTATSRSLRCMAMLGLG